jgi:small subunit ribosomal protein S6e
MVFKINISDKGKSWKLESEAEFIVGKSLGDEMEGKELSGDLEGYKLIISGGTDFAGFPMYGKSEGIGLKKVLFTKGWGMWDNKPGIRKRKTVRGKTISDKVTQINLRVLENGKKNLSEIFPDQNIVEQSTAVSSKEGIAESKAPEPKVKEEKVEAKVEVNGEKVEEKVEEAKVGENKGKEKVEEKIKKDSSSELEKKEDKKE